MASDSAEAQSKVRCHCLVMEDMVITWGLHFLHMLFSLQQKCLARFPTRSKRIGEYLVHRSG